MHHATGTSLSAVVPAAYSPHAVTFLRSLNRLGVDTIAAYERRTPAFSSRYCDERYLTPSPATDVGGYKDALLTLARRDDVRALVPMREVDAYVLAKYRDDFASAVTPLWPTFETLRTAHDRVELVEAARDASVATPETRLLDDGDPWETGRVVKARYPLLAPEYVGPTMGEGTSEAKSIQYLAADADPDRDAIRAEMGHVPIVQEYVPGDEYAFWALYEDGEPVATCQKHQVRAFSYVGGTSVCRETVRIPALERAGRALLDHLDWTGFASVQFVRDERTGEFTLLEINPRVWVSVACPVRAGVDFPAYYWHRSNGESVEAPTDYETGVATHRLGGEVLYLLSVVRGDVNPFVEAPSVSEAVREVATSIYRQPNFDYLALDDPGPFVRDLVNWVGRKVDVTDSIP